MRTCFDTIVTWLVGHKCEILMVLIIIALVLGVFGTDSVVAEYNGIFTKPIGR